MPAPKREISPRRHSLTTTYIPGKGIVSTNDPLLVPITVGKSRMSLRKLPPTDFAYGDASYSPNPETASGSIRQTSSPASSQNEKRSDDVKHNEPASLEFDIVAMNRVATQAGHIHPGSHYAHRKQGPIMRRPAANHVAPGLLPSEKVPNHTYGVACPPDEVGVAGLMSNKFATAWYNKAQARQAREQRRVAEVLENSRKHVKLDKIGKKPPRAQSLYHSKQMKSAGKEHEDIFNVGRKWEAVDPKISTHRTPEDLERHQAVRNRVVVV